MLYAVNPSSPARAEWVGGLVAQLRKVHGVNAVEWDTAVPFGADLTTFMEAATTDSAWILAVCTPDYKARFDMRKGGVGFEGRLLANRLASEGAGTVIPILREGEIATAIPKAFSGLRAIDLRNGVDQRRQILRLAQLMTGASPAHVNLGPSADVRVVWVVNGHPEAEVFRWDDVLEDGKLAHDDIGTVPLDVWSSGRALRWRDRSWLVEVPEPPWASSGTLLYRHEHPEQPYITAFRAKDPPVPLTFGGTVELSERDMLLAQNAHLRRHWVPRRHSAGGPTAGRFNQIASDEDLRWMDHMHPSFRPCVNAGLAMRRRSSEEEVAASLTAFGVKAPTRSKGATQAARSQADPLPIALRMLRQIRDELGLSAIRLGDLQAYVDAETDLDLHGAWMLVQTIKICGLHISDPREHFPDRVRASEVVVVRVPDEGDR